MNHLAGLQRTFGLHALPELGKAVHKAAFVCGTGCAVIGTALPGLVGLGATGPAAGADRVSAAMSSVLFALGLALVAVVDLPLQLNSDLAKLCLSKHEIKQENRESEGSPKTKASQRRFARQAARRALAPALASATVVVVNPAHLAVALRSVPTSALAPIVLAKVAK